MWLISLALKLSWVDAGRVKRPLSIDYFEAEIVLQIVKAGRCPPVVFPLGKTSTVSIRT